MTPICPTFLFRVNVLLCISLSYCFYITAGTDGRLSRNSIATSYENLLSVFKLNSKGFSGGGDVFQTEHNEILRRHKRDGTDILKPTPYDGEQRFNNEMICNATGICDVNKKLFIPNCYCDSVCPLYEDCCFDYKNKVNTTSDKLKTLSYDIQDQTCMGLTSSDVYGVWTINKCVPNSQDRLDKQSIDKCVHTKGHSTDVLDILPVSDAHGNVFRNKYCALCSGVTRYVFWDVAFFISHTKSKTAKCSTQKINVLKQPSPSILSKANYLLSVCDHVFDFSKVPKPRFCLLTSNKRSCASYQNPVMKYRIRVNKNMDCCHKYEEINCSENVMCISFQSLYDRSVNKFNRIKSLMVLFQIHTTEVGFSERKNCADLKYTQICSAVDCTNNHLDNTICGLEELYNGKVFSHTMTMSFKHPVDFDFLYRAVTTLVSYLSVAQRVLQISPYHGFINIKEEQNISYFNANITFQCLTSKPTALGHIKKIKRWFDRLKFEYSEEALNCSVNHSTVDFTGFKLSCENCESYSFRYNMDRLVILDGPYRGKRSAPYSFTLENVASLPTETCDKIKIKIKETTSLKDNVTEYKFSDLTCVVLNQTEAFILYDGTVEGYLTYICFSISCICIVPSLIIHIKSSNFKTTAGKNIFNILSVLLLSQVLFMFGIDTGENYVVCLVIGICLHFLYLSFFSWLSVSLLYILYTLLLMENYPGRIPSNDWKITVMCTVIAYGIPGTIVTSSVIVHYLGIVGIDIGYVQNNICFPTTFPANLVVFIVPVAIMLLVNILCVFMCIKIIRQFTGRGSDTIGSKFTRFHTYVYLKLLCISGFTWIFGLIASITQIVYFRYCFVVGAGLQGVFVCIAFIFEGLKDKT